MRGMQVRLLIRGFVWLCLVAAGHSAYQYYAPDTTPIIGPEGMRPEFTVGYDFGYLSRTIAAFVFLVGLAGILLWEWRRLLRPGSADQRNST